MSCEFLVEGPSCEFLVEGLKDEGLSLGEDVFEGVGFEEGVCRM